MRVADGEYRPYAPVGPAPRRFITEETLQPLIRTRLLVSSSLEVKAEVSASVKSLRSTLALEGVTYHFTSRPPRPVCHYLPNNSTPRKSGSRCKLASPARTISTDPFRREHRTSRGVRVVVSKAVRRADREVMREVDSEVVREAESELLIGCCRD